MSAALMTTPLSKLPVSTKEMLVSLVARRSQLRNVKLGKLLVAAKLTTPQAVEAALAAQASGRKARLGDILIAMGEVSAQDIATVLDHRFGLMYVDLGAYPVNDEAVRKLTAAIAHKYGVLPIEFLDDVLYVAAAKELSAEDLKIIAYTSRCREVVLLLASRREQLSALLSRKYFRHESIIFAKEKSPDISSQGEGPGMESTLKAILAQAVVNNASDIHIQLRQGASTSSVMFRIDGMLLKFMEIPEKVCTRALRQLEVLAGMGMRKPNEAKEGRLSFFADGYPIDLRISMLPSAVGLSVVLRILDPRNFPAGVGELGLSQEQVDVLVELMARPHGLFLLTGPTGSGKTTTLYTMLQQLHREGGRNIVTAEDPVEFILEGLNQINTSNFAHTLKLLLRHDPDVIMVGELRDADSGLTAVNAAITGHFVLSTLHANDSVSAVHRLLALGIPPVLIASSLAGVMSQRLVRLTCRVCGGVGCETCRNTGYHGRKLVAEIIRPKPTFGAALHTHSSYEDILAQVDFVGGVDLDAALIQQVSKGLTDLAEVRTRVSNPAKIPADILEKQKLPHKS